MCCVPLCVVFVFVWRGQDVDPALQAVFLRMKQERDVAVQGLKLMQLTLKEAQASALVRAPPPHTPRPNPSHPYPTHGPPWPRIAGLPIVCVCVCVRVCVRAALCVCPRQEAGLSPEEATLLGERNSLLHYACKLERAQREVADVTQRRVEGSVKMVRLFGTVQRLYDRTMSRRFAVWKALLQTKVRVPAPPPAPFLPPSRPPTPPPPPPTTHHDHIAPLSTPPPLGRGGGRRGIRCRPPPPPRARGLHGPTLPPRVVLPP